MIFGTLFRLSSLPFHRGKRARLRKKKTLQSLGEIPQSKRAFLILTSVKQGPVISPDSLDFWNDESQGFVCVVW
jgi:hypothetical protein